MSRHPRTRRQRWAGQAGANGGAPLVEGIGLRHSLLDDQPETDEVP